MATAQIASARAQFNHKPHNPFKGMSQTMLLDATRSANRKLQEVKSSIQAGDGTVSDLYGPANELAQISAAERPGLWFSMVEQDTLIVWVGRDLVGERTGKRNVDVQYC